MVGNVSSQILFLSGYFETTGKALVSLCLHVARWSTCLCDLVLDWEKLGNWNHAFPSALMATLTIPPWWV